MTPNDPLSGPHTHSGNSTQMIMLTVFIALAPALFFGIYAFGWPALFLLLLTIGSAYLAEFIALYLARRSWHTPMLDGSTLLTACLLAMSLPPWAPWWIGVFGGMFAIFFGKQIFGGIGQNVFNPAMLARVALLIAFPLQMTTWVNPQPITSANAPGFVESLSITFAEQAAPDSVSSATVLGEVKTGLTQNVKPEQSLQKLAASNENSFYGFSGGSMGETSALLILLGGLLLLYKRIISWHIPASMIATMALLAWIFHLINPDRYLDVSVHILNGGLLLGAFFIATDPVTSPSTRKGQLIFGAGCGTLDFVIRSWGGYPEGIGFAVLLMNAVTPLIDHYVRPRIYGRTASGEAIPVQPGEDKNA